MSNVKAAFKALTAEQQAIVERTPGRGRSAAPTSGCAAAARSPSSTARSTRSARAAAASSSAASRASTTSRTRCARSCCRCCRSCARTTIPSVPLELRIDLTGAEQPQQARRASDPVQEGRLPQGRRHLLRRPVVRRATRTSPTARDVQLRGHRPRPLLEKTKRSASGKTKRKTKRKKKTELSVTLSAPDRATTPPPARGARDVPKAVGQGRREPHGRQAQRHRRAAAASRPRRSSGCCSS